MRLRDRLILLLADKETIYAGRGTYHWLTWEGKIVIRNSQRVVGTGRVADAHTESYQGILYTADREQTFDALNNIKARKEAEEQALAYYEWLTKYEEKV